MIKKNMKRIFFFIFADNHVSNKNLKWVLTNAIVKIQQKPWDELNYISLIFFLSKKWSKKFSYHQAMPKFCDDTKRIFLAVEVILYSANIMNLYIFVYKIINISNEQN